MGAAANGRVGWNARRLLQGPRARIELRRVLVQNRPQKQMPPDMARRLQAPITAIRCLTPRGPAHQVLEPKITAHAQYDDFTVEVSSLEQLRDTLQLAHCCTSPSSTSQHIGLRLRVCTRARPGRLALAGRPYSNAYVLIDPASKSDQRTGTPDQENSKLLQAPAVDPNSPLERALARFAAAVAAKRYLARLLALF